jgi:hypothetical protein
MSKLSYLVVEKNAHIIWEQGTAELRLWDPEMLTDDKVALGISDLKIY